MGEQHKDFWRRQQRIKGKKTWFTEYAYGDLDALGTELDLQRGLRYTSYDEIELTEYLENQCVKMCGFDQIDIHACYWLMKGMKNITEIARIVGIEKDALYKRMKRNNYKGVMHYYANVCHKIYDKKDISYLST